MKAKHKLKMINDIRNTNKSKKITNNHEIKINKT